MGSSIECCSMIDEMGRVRILALLLSNLVYVRNLYIQEGNSLKSVMSCVFGHNAATMHFTLLRLGS